MRLIYFAVAALLFLAAGCSADEVTPEETFDHYVSLWESGQFAAMYDLLSTEAKAVYDRDYVVERYENIYDGIGANSLQVRPSYPEEAEMDEDGQVRFPFSVTMKTVAGEVRFEHTVTLVQEQDEEAGEKRWGIVWDPSMIFPQLEGEDKVRVEILEAHRGEIVDRNGIGLAINGTLGSVGVVPARLEEGEDLDQALEQLAKELGLSVDRIKQELDASWVQPDWFVPLATIAKDDEEKKTRLLSIKGVMIQDTPGRVYPHKESAAHLTGYIQPLTAEEWEELREKGYRQTDWIGKTGVEQWFEERLRGKHGAIIYTTDENNNRKEIIAQQDPVHGENITLTIDIRLQEELYRQLEGEAGTAVAIHPRTGEILALVNSPAYDPNLFIVGLSPEQWQAWSEDPAKPLFNRFNQAYPPGSAFKPVTAAIALEEGVISPEETIHVSGLRWQPDASWGQYHVTRVTDPGQPVDLTQAMAYSDNIYFAQAALKLGQEAFKRGAEAFGFGTPLPLDVPVTVSRLSNEEKQWDDVQLAVSGFGQGEVMISPLHLAVAYTPFLNQGDLVAPRLELNGESTLWKEQIISPATADLIRQTLIEVVEHPQGTGRGARLAGRTIGGKTGTAELKASLDEQGKEYGWFVAFDADQEQVLVVMMIEGVEDKGGSAYVVPKVRKVLDAYLQSLSVQ
ncbi:penicillin-binding protein 3 [Caldalkalibacillus thermarum]|uniref:penicillin-binding transpeptidase domain-containing protein n=1 Tax=Caldalkalibacillus thermarum TaxID=296745 RepID=UPI0016663D90|nr:penicillin-binding transpeptidase domain-containing protein [Caldalkalibacillus thermarum]GGK21822.1 penicillin-binding protein 3 [Caldalkalibacillus thermarum]